MSRNTIANIGNLNKNESTEEEKKLREIKKEETKIINNIFEEKPQEQIRKTMTSIEPKNKMVFRFENMVAEDHKKEEKKNIVSSQPKKLDFASKLSGLENVLAGRMSMGGNVFTMPTGGIKQIKTSEIIRDDIKKENEDENLKTEEKEISKENMNAILEDNKIQETSYEKQLEKKKENTVVVKKKKPKRKEFVGIPDVNNIKNEDNSKIENKENKDEVFNANKYIPPKIDFFSDDNIPRKEEDKKEEDSKQVISMKDLFNNTKPNKINLFDDNKNDNNQQKEGKEKNNMNNLFKDINEIPNQNINTNNDLINKTQEQQLNDKNNNILEKNILEPSLNNIFINDKQKEPSNINIPNQNNNIFEENNNIVEKNINQLNINNNISSNIPKESNIFLDINKMDNAQNDNENKNKNIFDINMVENNNPDKNENNTIENNIPKTSENNQQNEVNNNINTNINNDIFQMNQPQNIEKENIHQPNIMNNNIFDNQIQNQPEKEIKAQDNNNFSIFDINEISNINQEKETTKTNNIFDGQKQNETNENKPNIFMQEINNQQNNQQTKKFRSMFEDDDDNKISFKKEEFKNPKNDKRLSFLFEDD